MASGPSMHSPGSRALEAMPTSYTLILFLWSLPFAAVVLFLVIFYASVLILSVQGFVTELVRPSNNNGPLFFSILGTIVGAYLLAIIAKALTTVQVPQGVRLPAGAVPQLDSLIRDCTTQAGIEPPDDVFIVPDANAFAYSSGRFSLHERLNHYVMIGAPLLVHLEPPDLAAVLYHEFGHLLLRRGLWAVSLHHKVEDFLTRCLRAQLHRQGCALAFTFVPGMVVLFFLRLFRWSLAGFSKREELLVDSVAGRLLGEWQFRERLVRSITTIAALQVRLAGERSLVEQSNAEFHRRLMGAAPTDGGVATPNYFAVARSVPVQTMPLWEDRLAGVYQGLINKESGPTESHPSLAERIRNLHGVVASELPFYPSSSAHLFSVPAGAETMVSAALASELRATFFKETLAARRGPLEGITSESVAEFRCRYTGCPRVGQVELAMTEDDLYLSSAEAQYRLRWHEISSVTVYTGGTFNFFLEAARVLLAAFREAPSDRTLRLQITNGGMIEFPHWHVLDNIQEVEVLLLELWGLPRIFGTVTDGTGTPVRGAVARAHDEHGAICSTSLTGEDGTYSLTLRTGGRFAISVRAPGFVEEFASCEVGYQQKHSVPFVLHSAHYPDAGVAAPAIPRRPPPIVIEELRAPNRSGAGAQGCLASLLKLGCAAFGYLLPFLIAIVVTLQTKDSKTFGNWMGPCTVIGFCTAAVGWRLGNRLALKYLFTKAARNSRC